MPLLTILLLSCTAPAGKDAPGDTSDTSDDTSGDARPVGENVSVSVFAGEHVYYGAENRRSIDVEVTFPDDVATYTSLTGRFRLDCPDGACDWWDRYGTFGVVLHPGAETEDYVEIDRFITPYGVAVGWESDLTALRPLLTGTVTIRVFIDTWVGPGHEQGNGWLFTADLDFAGGPPPSPEPVEVVPVWHHLSWLAGLPDSPVEQQVVPRTVTLPEAAAITFRSFISGHGWNNSQNCAEFCEKEHFYSVGGEEFSRVVWRDDCEDTVTDDRQQGTWRTDRAGWCPGAQVYPWDTDVTAHAAAGEVPVSYRLEDFTWAGDGDQPYYYLSGVLLVYR